MNSLRKSGKRFEYKIKVHFAIKYNCQGGVNPNMNYDWIEFVFIWWSTKESFWNHWSWLAWIFIFLIMCQWSIKLVRDNLSLCIYLSIKPVLYWVFSQLHCFIMSIFHKIIGLTNGNSYYHCWCTLKTAIHILWTRKIQNLYLWPYWT